MKDMGDRTFEDKPICTFPKLKDCLTKKGFVIGVATAWKSVGVVEVLPEVLDQRIILDEDGIFYIDDDGIKRRGFMYKKEFWFEYKGVPQQPKFHVCKCTAIEDFGKDSYRFANNMPVRMISKNTDEEEEVTQMDLCGFCSKILSEKEEETPNSLADFVDILKKEGDVKEPIETDIFGYVKNWEEISLAYRQKKDFTCERCGTHVEEMDHFFMQTHHKNGDKTDNSEKNLECLCIKCHSGVDEAHKKNFSSKASQSMINEYMQKYHSDGNKN